MNKDEFGDFVLWVSRNLTVSIAFEPRDIWIGVYWNISELFQELDVYICIVPMFPIKIEYIFDEEE